MQAPLKSNFSGAKKKIPSKCESEAYSLGSTQFSLTNTILCKIENAKIAGASNECYFVKEVANGETNDQLCRMLL